MKLVKTMFSTSFSNSNLTNDLCLQKIVQSGWLGSNQRYFSYTDGSGRGMVALQRRRGVHVRRGGGTRRGCYIAPFTFLHQAIVLRHGPFWHNHNVIIITVAAAAFAATALCVEMGFTQTSWETNCNCRTLYFNFCFWFLHCNLCENRNGSGCSKNTKILYYLHL